jgi:hypothetical protein
MKPTAAPARTPLLRVLCSSFVSAVIACAAWFAWLGWDHSYYVVHGVTHGPYRPWQVVGCGATVAAGAVAAFLRSRRFWSMFVIVPATLVGFAIPWGLDAASDETGMWVVGLVYLVVGGGIGLGSLLVLVGGIEYSVHEP